MTGLEYPEVTMMTLIKLIAKSFMFVGWLITGAYINLYMYGLLASSQGFVLAALLVLPLVVVHGLALFDIFKK